VDKAEASIRITNAHGLHVRTAAIVTKAVIAFRSQVTIAYGDKRADARSAVDLISLGAGQGALINVEGRGPDADDAVETVRKLFESGFGED